MNKKKIRKLAGGIRSYFPLKSSHKGTGGTDSSRYCFSVWMRHLVLAYKNGLTNLPNVIAELGPGDSIGVGLTALLSGVERYYALDVIQHATIERNIKIFDELTELFKQRANIPGDDEFPKIHPRLKSYDFPHQILTEERLKDSLNENRIQLIRDNLSSVHKTNDDSIIRYISSWSESEVIENCSVDMIFSQAVMEHVKDLDTSYSAMFSWLRSGGIMAHQIDFESHGISNEWNGHWSYSDLTWKLIMGKRSYLINREPLSTHIKLLNEKGFNVVAVITTKDYPSDTYTGAIQRSQLANKYRNLSDEDFTTTSVYILAKKLK